MTEPEQFADDLWVVEGSNVRDFRIWFTTRMVIVRLSNGFLWVDSPVHAMSDELKSVTALGPVRYLIAATPRHVWRLTAARFFKATSSQTEATSSH